MVDKSNEKNTHQSFGDGAPRPSALQILGARIQIHAQRHPVGHALRFGAAAGGITVPLAAVVASSSLASPGDIPVGTLAAILVATLVAATGTGLVALGRARSLPGTEETDPARYASARVQAASGRLGPDRETNRLARSLCDRFAFASKPGFHVGSMLLAGVFIALLSLTNTTGPGFDPQVLVQPFFLATILLACAVLYYFVKSEHDRFEAFRAAYDQQHGSRP